MNDHLTIIKHYESYRSEAYRCPAGVWTIGYGSTIVGGLPVRDGQTITRSEAESELNKSTELLRGQILKELNDVELLPYQIEALISFVYNIGIGRFRGSTMRRLLLRGEINLAAEEFPKWNKARVNGKLIELPELKKRRRAEYLLFTTGQLILK